MKKLLIISIAIFFGLSTIYAQDMQINENKQDITVALNTLDTETLSNSLMTDVIFGIKGGLNQSTITGDDVDSFTCLTCFHIGVMSELFLSDDFALLLELLYSCQGSEYRFEDFYDDYPTTILKAASSDYKVKLSYLNVPVMARYYVTDGLSLEVGPQVGFLLSAKDEYGSEEEDIKEHVKGLDFGANFGLGYKFENGLFLGARYNLGLTDANDNPDYLGDSDYKNSVFQFSVGFFF